MVLNCRRDKVPAEGAGLHRYFSKFTVV